MRQQYRRDLILERELWRARLAGGASASQLLVLDDAIPPLVETVRRLYPDVDLDIICCIPKQTVFRGDRKDVLELLGNLHNGDIVFGRSSQLGGCLVEVTLSNGLSRE